MPVNFEKYDIGIATRVSESIKRELDRIADEHDRKPGYIIRELLIRGLALYRMDGRLKDEAPPGVKARKAPIVMRIEPGRKIDAEPTKDDVRRMITSEQEDAIARQLKPRKRKAR